MENSIISLLGKSLESEEIVSFRNQYNLQDNPEIFLDFVDDIFDGNLSNEKDGIYMTFVGYKRFKYEYGESDEILKTPDKSLFLTDITLENDYINTKAPCTVKFPFGLMQGDDYTTVVNKIGKKPNEKGIASYGKYYCTEFDDYRILTAFDKDLEILTWIRIFKITLQEKERKSLIKFLSQQSYNINPENADLILSFLEKLPTIEWEKRRKEGDREFTKNKIAIVETLLKDYIHKLVKLTREKKATAIYNSIEKLVSAINKLNPKYDYFIETMEREELCKFINDIIRTAGLEFETNIDLTEEWREW
ncbi:hypothetical protein [Flavobacterium sp.]|uniref:hypothetical protein n=1 Tax=Flavobacterium sp. TaxID=239 RepID=UPI0031DE2FB7